jgi:hypothetical protein
MEHRHAERKPAHVAVVVGCPRIGLVRGTAVNLSAGGMFIETPCVVMPMNSPVTVSFQLGPADRGVCFQLQGMVVHEAGKGFGVMFEELAPACRLTLRRLMELPDAVDQPAPEGTHVAMA